MEAHLQALKEEVSSKQALLAQREEERNLNWATWAIATKELKAQVLQETREELFELKRQVGTTLASYSAPAPFGQRFVPPLPTPLTPTKPP